MSNINFDQRLSRLENRRKGIDLTYSFDSLNEGITSYHEFNNLKASKENWQTISNKKSIRYVAGAMQEVGKRYTEISIETAIRIQKQLEPKLLNTYGIETVCRLQGSVPLNVHIKGVSDVDLLILDKYHYRSEKNLEQFRSNDIKILNNLRSICIHELKKSYPAAKVDSGGAKCITLSGGSLPRDVDIIPSHWVETIEYKNENKIYQRGVNILDSKTPSTLMNLPFKHIYLVDFRCKYLTDGNLKKSIRLCKTVKADLIEEGQKIYLSSFDLASIMYHANTSNLKKGRNYALAIVLETQRFFDYLYHNPTERQFLYTPDNSRRIFDTKDKEDSLLFMSIALDNLVKELLKDIDWTFNAGLNYFPLAI